MTSIRQMTTADIPAADAILQAAHAVTSSFSTLLRRNLALTPQHWWMLDSGANPCGVVGATDYEQFAHIGLMAIDPAAQLAGAGATLLTHCLDRLLHNAITLYSTDAGLAFYPRHRFRWAGLTTEWQLRKRTEHNPTLQIAPARDLVTLANWDLPIFGGNRLPLLEALNREHPDRTFIALNAQGRIEGFLHAQPAVIGPFAANTPEAAADLLHHALHLDFEQTPRIVLPDANAHSEALVIAAGFTPTRTSRYFIRGESPRQQRDKLFAIAAYSLG